MLDHVKPRVSNGQYENKLLKMEQNLRKIQKLEPAIVTLTALVMVVHQESKKLLVSMCHVSFIYSMLTSDVYVTPKFIVQLYCITFTSYKTQFLIPTSCDSRHSTIPWTAINTALNGT